MKRSLSLTVSVYGLLLASLSAWSKPTRLESYGDSITAGFLSNTSVVAPPSLERVSEILSDLFRFGISRNPRWLVAHHAPDDAWPAVLGRRAAAAGVPMTLVNRAISKSRAANTIAQVRAAGSTAEPTLAFLLIGHNDLPHATTPESLALAFTRETERAIAEWDRNHRNSTLYLLGIGDVAQVFHLLNGYVWHTSSEGRYTCNRSWDMFYYPKVYADRFRQGDLDKFLRPRQEAINRSLEALTVDWSKKSANNQFRYVAKLTETKYEIRHFAVDCFHLSAEGERELGERLYEQVDPRDLQ